MPNLVASDTEPDDIEPKQEDHAADALRYGVMSRPMQAYNKQSTREIEQWERLMLNRKVDKGAGERNRITGY